MANSKGKVQVKAEVKKKAVKPKMGKGTGGILPTSIRLKIESNKKK